MRGWIFIGGKRKKREEKGEIEIVFFGVGAKRNFVQIRRG